MFQLQQRVQFADGQRGVVVQVLNGGGEHGCYVVQSDTGARFTAHAAELSADPKRIPPPQKPLASGECRTIVRYETPHRQRTPSQQQQGNAAPSHAPGERVIVAVATNRGAEWVKGYIDRFVVDGTRVRVKLDDGRILPACDPACVWSVN